MEGTTEKVLQFKMPVKSIDNKNIDLIVILNNKERFKQ